jgi:hypothetical protein
MNQMSRRISHPMGRSFLRPAFNRNSNPLFTALSILCLSLACVWVLGTTPSQAESIPHVERHAHKVQKRLARFAPGKYLHLVFLDDTESYGALGPLSRDSFRFTNADTNTTATYEYAAVSRIRTDKEYIGEGTGPERHIRHLVPILIGAAAAGGTVAYVEMR